MTIKLNLGSGGRNIHGFINIDSRDDVNADEVGEITDLSWLSYAARNSVDLILCIHALEHLKNPFSALTDWYRSLKPEGELYLSVPDMDAVMRYYVKLCDEGVRQAEALGQLKGFIWGGQKYEYDYHYTGWNFGSILHNLTLTGFRTVEKYDWRKTEWSYIDSYEQSYLPHLDKNGGTLLSLNVRAIK